MLPILSLLVLAIAVSLDGFGVGMMYGLRRIRIGLLSVAIISCFSGIIIYMSMGIGQWLSSFLSPAWSSRVGAIILIGIGVWALVQLFMQKNHDSKESSSDTIAQKSENEESTISTVKEILNIELRRFGLVIQILRTPAAADIDKSGSISASEAVFLGLALSLDSFGAGIGAALIGFAPALTATVIALSSGTFIALGLHFGLKFADLAWVRKMSLLPGCVLIIMGVIKLL
ncbi:sporulation membrane protein YtaF [Paenibacillus sp. N1-5-1-14]|uniref:sporulation membrane protein YtaF n=1 Tax=Paenibacillus radicibacter TaxID=2972488 RepID=UPI0021593925|nr:sporulation membrane protein YtaF [Paenibacillus radicibacter]MCR8643743.1 sporulation membrane protein YtaF [Paenibacillus radicibacter]